MRIISGTLRGKKLNPFQGKGIRPTSDRTREAIFNILYDYGLDDIGAMFDYVFGSGKIFFRGEKFKTRKKFIKYIEENNLEEALVEETQRLWSAVELAFEQEVRKRKDRF